MKVIFPETKVPKHQKIKSLTVVQELAKPKEKVLKLQICNFEK
jgi:hypothetical protein